jgi:disulfide bond formation protein DsbB
MRKGYLLNLELLINAIELVGIIFVLLLAFASQLLLHVLPCPLCLLQRVGFFLIAFGFLMNLRFGVKPIHYSMVIIAAVFTCFVALRQIALHVMPGTSGYGSPIFGFHLYTWSFIIAMIIVLVTALIMSLDRRSNRAEGDHFWPFVTHTLFAIIVLLIAANLISVFLECGLKQCPDNPVRYELLH